LGIWSRLSKLVTTRGSLTKDSLNMFLADTIGMALGILSSILMARLFGPSGKGIITMVSLIPMTLLFIGLFGLNDTATYFISRFRDRIRENFYTIHFLSWASGIVVVAAAYLSFGYWYQAYASYPRQLFLIALPAALFLILTTTLRSSLLGLQRIWEYNLLNIVQVFLNLVIVAVAGLLLGRSLKSYFILYIIILVFVSGYGLGLARRNTEISRVPRGLNLRPILSYAARVYPVSLVVIMQGRLDHFLIGYFLKPSELGIYSIAILLSENLLRITAAFQMALFPRVSADWTDQKFSLAARVLRVINLLNIILSLLVAAVGYPLILLLFGRAFLPAYWPLLFLLLARIPEGLNKISSSSIIGIGRPGMVSIFGVLGVVLNGVLGWLLIPKMGILGASLAKMTASFLQALPALVFFSLQSKMSLYSCLVPHREDYDLIKTKVRSWLVRPRQTGNSE